MDNVTFGLMMAAGKKQPVLVASGTMTAGQSASPAMRGYYDGLIGSITGASTPAGVIVALYYAVSGNGTAMMIASVTKPSLTMIKINGASHELPDFEEYDPGLWGAIFVTPYAFANGVTYNWEVYE